MLKRVNITLDTKHIKALDTYAEKIGKNRSAVLRDWIVDKLLIESIDLSAAAPLMESPIITDALPMPQR